MTKRILKLLLKLLFLLPVTAVYWLVTFLRNKFYDWGVFKQTKLPVKVISIGNLSTGGTGKTILAEYLLEYLLGKGLQAAYLSRGYGRDTQGYICVNHETHTFKDVGDEALQVATKFPKSYVCVCEDRVKGVTQMLKENPALDVVILDDAFQHRAIYRDLDIVMIDASNLPWNSFLLPLGSLRESVLGLKRAQVVIFSKIIHKKIVPKLEQLMKGKTAVYSSIKPEAIYSFEDPSTPLPVSDMKQTGAVVFSGLGNNYFFEEHLKYNAIYTMHRYQFRDHHPYKERDIKRILRRYKVVKSERFLVKSPIIITTEKDFNRLKKEQWFWELYTDHPFYYITVSLDFFKNSRKLTKELGKIFPHTKIEEESDLD